MPDVCIPEIYGYFCTSNKFRVLSSVGSEHYLDRVGVTGSNPVAPTKLKVNRLACLLAGFFYLFSCQNPAKYGRYWHILLYLQRKCKEKMLTNSFSLDHVHPRKDGRLALKLRIARSRTDFVYIGLKMHYLPEQWDANRERVVNTVTATLDNARLNNYRLNLYMKIY